MRDDATSITLVSYFLRYNTLHLKILLKVRKERKNNPVKT